MTQEIQTTQPLANTSERYGLIAQSFHWITAILILSLLVLGVFMTKLPQATAGEIDTKVWFFSLHKTLGVTVFAVALLRVLWALISVKPKPLHPSQKLETFGAETVHWILYVAILLAPLTGLTHHAATTGFAPIWWPFSQKLPFVPQNEFLAEATGLAHWALALLMGLSIAAHIAGALKHFVIDRDQTLQRMIPGAYKSDTPVPVEAHSNLLSKLAAIGVYAALIAGVVGITSIKSHEHTLKNNVTTEVASVSGANWIVDHEASSLGISIVQLGSPVEGQFGTWDASINFTPDDLAGSSVNVAIDLGSLEIGTVTDQALSSDFLDIATFPEALFKTTSFSLVSANTYTSNGTLDLHGVTVPVALDFDLAIDGDNATMRGTATLDRMAFNIGAAGFSDEGSVGFDVEVLVDIKATKK